ncbi:MAG: hypothetical protein K2X86_14705 [Cytophagaceae bacterium]|nr:hypothetical protein [Cytophagaceae bacterium]
MENFTQAQSQVSAFISELTELKPLDIIKNPKGKLYQIRCYHSSKSSYQICPLDGNRDKDDDNPVYLIVMKEALVAKKWEKVAPETGEARRSA